MRELGSRGELPGKWMQFAAWSDMWFINFKIIPPHLPSKTFIQTVPTVLLRGRLVVVVVVVVIITSANSLSVGR